MKQRTIQFENEPVHPNLKPIKMRDGIYPKDLDDRNAYWDFINWYLAQEHAILLMIPKTGIESDFWNNDVDEFGVEVSAFNTHDYERHHPRQFNMDQYICNKIYEKVMDLALLHSVIKDAYGKENIKYRFMNLVDRKFRDQIFFLIEIHEKYPSKMTESKLKKEVAKINRKIINCKKIWDDNAYED